MAGDPSITELLIQWSQGNETALAELTPRVYRELHTIARKYLAHQKGNGTLQPTALIHEAYLRLMGTNVKWENRAHFFGIAARLMRLVLVDSARARRSQKRGGKARAMTIDAAAAIAPNRPPNVIEVDEALTALAAIDQRKATIVEMRYFGGISREESAHVLGLSNATITREMRLAEAWLRRYLLGHGEEEECGSRAVGTR
jgi:RNA polymerase sigma-70 factor, ECF subfamily